MKKKSELNLWDDDDLLGPVKESKVSISRVRLFSDAPHTQIPEMLTNPISKLNYQELYEKEKARSFELEKIISELQKEINQLTEQLSHSIPQIENFPIPTSKSSHPSSKTPISLWESDEDNPKLSNSEHEKTNQISQRQEVDPEWKKVAQEERNRRLRLRHQQQNARRRRGGGAGALSHSGPVLNGSLSFDSVKAALLEEREAEKEEGGGEDSGWDSDPKEKINEKSDQGSTPPSFTPSLSPPASTLSPPTLWSEEDVQREVRDWASRCSLSVSLMIQSLCLVFHGPLPDLGPLWTMNQSQPPNSPGEIRKAYLKVVRYCHPDKQPSTASPLLRAQASQTFTALTDAYNLYKTQNNLS